MKGDADAVSQPSPPNEDAGRTQRKATEDTGKQAEEDTSLVDSLLDEVKEEPTLENKNSTMTNQSQPHRDFKEAVLSANNKFQPTLEQ